VAPFPKRRLPDVIGPNPSVSLDKFLIKLISIIEILKLSDLFVNKVFSASSTDTAYMIVGVRKYFFKK
jgi:hypothetical protein